MREKEKKKKNQLKKARIKGGMEGRWGREDRRREEKNRNTRERGEGRGGGACLFKPSCLAFRNLSYLI